MDILNSAVVKERFEAACGFLSCSGHNDAVFLHFFLGIYDRDSKRFVCRMSSFSKRTALQVWSCDVEGCML